MDHHRWVPWLVVGVMLGEGVCVNSDSRHNLLFETARSGPLESRVSLRGNFFSRFLVNMVTQVDPATVLLRVGVLSNDYRIRNRTDHTCTRRWTWLSYCIIPLCWVTFCFHSGIIPVGQFSRRWIFRNRSFRLIWLIDDKLTLTWLVYWVRTARSVFTGGGPKETQHNGIVQYTFIFECGAWNLIDWLLKFINYPFECMALSTVRRHPFE